MKRRKFIKGAATVLGLAAAPGFIRRAFGDASAKPPKTPPAPVDLDGALGHARIAGRSLLVLVVPKDEPERSTRGHLWGSFLIHAPVDDFLRLAPYEVVCAPMKELQRLAPNVSGEPWAVLLSHDKPAVAIDGPIPPLPHPSGPGPRHNDFAEVDKAIEKQIAALGKLLKAGLPADLASKPLSAAEKKAAEHALAKRLREDAPPGSRWDKVWDCPPCGMAQTPAKSGRFLSFFVKGEPPPGKPPFSE